MLDTVLCVSNHHMKALSVTVNTAAWTGFYAMFPILKLVDVVPGTKT